MSGTGVRMEIRGILYCDLVRSTDHLVRARQQGRESAAGEDLVRFHDCWREALTQNGAVFVKPLGDGLLATAPDPIGLVRAIAQASDMASNNLEDLELASRVGLHVGTVGVRPDGDILGADAALGQRVMAEARAGQVFVSDACAAHLRPYLPPQYVLRDAGERMLKGFDRPIRLYQLMLVGSAPDDASPTPAEPPAPSRPIRILLVEDEKLLRDALTSLLKLEPDFDLVGQVGDGRSAVEECHRTRPDVVLTDIQMPVMDGIEATRRIREQFPDTEVCILTKFGDDEKVFAAIQAGAIGYMLKDAGVDEIGPVVRSVFRKEGFISPALAPRVMREFARITRVAHETRALFAELTRREVEVLELLGEGLRNRGIAERLFLSEKTVKHHISNILAKLQVNDRTEAALLARSHGLGNRG